VQEKKQAVSVDSSSLKQPKFSSQSLVSVEEENEADFSDLLMTITRRNSSKCRPTGKADTDLVFLPCCFQ